MEASNALGAVQRIEAIGDPATRLREATEGLSAAQQTMTELARLRRGLIQQLHTEGWSYAQIAEAAGLSRGRIHQVRHHGPAPEGAFFGRGPLTIATPLKREDRRDRPVVAAEDVASSQRLGELLRELEFRVSFEQIPLDGAIDLNRDGLIVICGPRISPAVAELLDGDPHIRFQKSAGAWTLHDQVADQQYRSGEDSTPATSVDFAYLARLPRPDGQGQLLVFTGIHPQGTLGVVELLATDLVDLHRDAGASDFSTILSVEYDAKTNEPIKTQLQTPIYQQSP